MIYTSSAPEQKKALSTAEASMMLAVGGVINAPMACAPEVVDHTGARGATSRGFRDREAVAAAAVQRRRAPIRRWRAATGYAPKPMV